MNSPRNQERVRSSALALLLDGNSIESVAQVLGVPVEVVMAWRLETPPTPTPTSGAARAIAPSPRIATVSRDDGDNIRFHSTLHYAAALPFRALCLAGAIGLATYGGAKALSMAGGDGAGPIEDVLALVTLVAALWAAVVVLRWSLRIVVLDREGVVVPGLLKRVAMPYSQIAGYSFEAGRRVLSGDVHFKGRLLVIRSLDAKAEPLAVFVYDAYPMDPRLLERLEAVVRANREAPWRTVRARTRSR